ncbi:MAG: HEPN domain-containing protein [Syntrophorhabdales bacterium]
MKACLVWHQIEFKKIHDIAALLKLASRAEPDLPEVLKKAELLTPYGVEYRYPGDYPQITIDIAKEVLGIAASVRDEVRKRLPQNTL